MSLLYGQLFKFLPKFSKPLALTTTLNSAKLHVGRTNFNEVGSESKAASESKVESESKVASEPKVESESKMVSEAKAALESDGASNFSSTSVTSDKEDEPDKLYKLIELEMRANQSAVLRSYATFTNMAAKELGLEIGKCWAPRLPHHERFTVLRSAFVHKRCRVQYEFRTYYRFMQLHRLTGSTADTYLEYIERNLPEGVALKVTKVAVEKIPDHIVPPQRSASSSIEAS